VSPYCPGSNQLQRWEIKQDQSAAESGEKCGLA
jgi:hypothetical protein